MNELLHAFATAITNNSFLAIIGALLLLGGLGERITVILSGRRRIAKLKTQLKSAQNEVTFLRELTRSGGPAQPATDRDLLHLLYQVQASDQLIPQLPQQLRDNIDAAIEQHRAVLPIASPSMLPDAAATADSE
jgi:hypothetical protein